MRARHQPVQDHVEGPGLQLEPRRLADERRVGTPVSSTPRLDPIGVDRGSGGSRSWETGGTPRCKPQQTTARGRTAIGRRRAMPRGLISRRHNYGVVNSSVATPLLSATSEGCVRVYGHSRLSLRPKGRQSRAGLGLVSRLSQAKMRFRPAAGDGRTRAADALDHETRSHAYVRHRRLRRSTRRRLRADCAGLEKARVSGL